MRIQRKPEWLRKKINLGEQTPIRNLLSELELNTVCQQALCPNISECFSSGVVTFLILGRDCTRQCSFCNVDKAIQPPLPPDLEEPYRIAEASARLGLSHVVITSPTRDDLADGGAAHYAATAAAIYERLPDASTELLIPDFSGKADSLKLVLSSNPTILAHNIETVPRLYAVRKGADYKRSINLLEQSALTEPAIPTKSGLMLGLGEKIEEVYDVLKELRGVGCSFLSLGQYLAPSHRHHPVVRYYHPDFFVKLRLYALDLGFRHVESGPYIRSSYHAEKYLD